MLKYRGILDKLTLRQKIALVTDLTSLSDGDINRAGVPSVSCRSLRELCEKNGHYPSYESAACSWNLELIECMTAELARKSGGLGGKLLKTPDIKSAVNAYKSGISEDPYLCGAIGGAIANASHTAGAACGISGMSIDSADAEYLDSKEDARAVNDLIFKDHSGTTPTISASFKQPTSVESLLLLRLSPRKKISPSPTVTTGPHSK